MIHTTPEAVRWIEHKLKQRGKGVGVYVAVVRSGCSGYSYSIDFIDEIGGNHLSYPVNDFVIAVDKDDLPLIDGLTLGIEHKGLNQSLTFTNPKATATCGCGTSFSID